MRSRPILILSTLICVAFASAAPAAIAKGVAPRFDLSDPSASPFPSDRFTVPDASQLTRHLASASGWERGASPGPRVGSSSCLSWGALSRHGELAGGCLARDCWWHADLR